MFYYSLTAYRLSIALNYIEESFALVDFSLCYILLNERKAYFSRTRFLVYNLTILSSNFLYESASIFLSHTTFLFFLVKWPSLSRLTQFTFSYFKSIILEIQFPSEIWLEPPRFKGCADDRAHGWIFIVIDVKIIEAHSLLLADVVIQAFGGLLGHFSATTHTAGFFLSQILILGNFMVIEVFLVGKSWQSCPHPGVSLFFSSISAQILSSFLYSLWFFCILEILRYFSNFW